MAQPQNFGDKLISSIGGVVIGIVIFLASFVVLFNTEGRTDYSTVAQKAELAGESAGGNFVYATGDLQAGSMIGDDYLLEGEFVALKRNVETYAWEEKVESDDNDVRYYKYTTNWVKEPADSDEFNQRRGHENYYPEIKDLSLFSDQAFVGEYEIFPDKVRMPSYERLEVSRDILKNGYNGNILDNYLFIGYGTMEQPEVGDTRISYEVVKPGQKATVFGRPDGSKLEAHHGESEKPLYRVFWGTKDDAMAQLKQEYSTEGWTWRIIGFILMWVGLMLIFKPLTVAFEAIPLVSKLGKSAVTAVTFLAALILTVITSLVSMVLHNPVGIAAIIVVIVGAAYFFLMKKQQSAIKGGPGEETPSDNPTP